MRITFPVNGLNDYERHMNISPGTILGVEDKARIHKFLIVSREAHGLVAHESCPDREGLQLCASVQPDCV
jgi:hypothetical protein